MGQETVDLTSGDEEILSPFPDERDVHDTVLTERLTEIDNASIGLFSNNKRNADQFLWGVSERIADSTGCTFGDVIFKSIATNAASDEVFDQLTNYDAVLIAYGDCGSCSSWTIHDAIQLERMGIPTVVFCSDEFTSLAQYEAENQDCPGLPIVEFEHPIANLSPDEVKGNRVTRNIIEEAEWALTHGPSDLRSRYEGKYIAGVSKEDASSFGACTL